MEEIRIGMKGINRQNQQDLKTVWKYGQRRSNCWGYI